MTDTREMGDVYNIPYLFYGVNMFLYIIHNKSRCHLYLFVYYFRIRHKVMKVKMLTHGALEPEVSSQLLLSSLELVSEHRPATVHLYI